MNTNHFRVIFNKQRNCMMAVSEVASSTGKSKSGKSRTKRCNHCVLSVSSTSKLNLGDFYPLKMAAAQSTRARAATNSIVIYLPGINLTGDVIMLEEREVDAPNSNGTTSRQKVLVPIVYLASIKPGDL